MAGRVGDEDGDRSRPSGASTLDAPFPPLPPGSTRAVRNALLAVVAMVVANVGLAIVLIGVAEVLGVDDDAADDALTVLDVATAQAAALGALLWFAGRRSRWSATDLGLRRSRGVWPSVGIAAGCYVTYLVVAAAWVSLVGAPSRRHALLEAVDEQPPFVVTAAIVLGACVAAPVIEELLFRGFLYRALAARRGHLVGGLVSSAVFGSLHGLAVPLKMLPVLGALGFALCVLYRATGSLLPSIGLHAFQNSLATGIALDFGAATLLLMGGAGLAIWLVLTPWRRADPLPRRAAAGPDEGSEARNAALPDWARRPLPPDASG